MSISAGLVSCSRQAADPEIRLDPVKTEIALRFSMFGLGSINPEEEIIQSYLADDSGYCYVFTSDNRVMYVGKSSGKIKSRMNQYLRPKPSQSTNVRNHRLIVEQLSNNKPVDLWVTQVFFDFLGKKVNISSGLERFFVKRYRSHVEQGGWNNWSLKKCTKEFGDKWEISEWPA